MLPISIFFIVKNEADRIGKSIAAVQHLSDDIVVVDSGSTDGSQDIAAGLGARVVFNSWPGYGQQKRFAEDLCRHPWLLNLDADEWVPSELAAEIAGLFAAGEPPCEAYRLQIAEIFPGEAAPHPWAYSLAPVRLYRRDCGRYSPSPVHDRVELKPGVREGQLRGVVHHRSVRSLGNQIEKLNHYSDQQAADMAARNVSLPVWRVFTEFPTAFLKAYVIRRHFMRGVYGYLTAMNYAISRHLRIAKHYERRRLADNSRATVEKTEKPTARPSP